VVAEIAVNENRIPIKQKQKMNRVSFFLCKIIGVPQGAVSLFFFIKHKKMFGFFQNMSFSGGTKE